MQVGRGSQPERTTEVSSAQEVASTQPPQLSEIDKKISELKGQLEELKAAFAKLEETDRSLSDEHTVTLLGPELAQVAKERAQAKKQEIGGQIAVVALKIKRLEREIRVSQPNSSVIAESKAEISSGKAPPGKPLPPLPEKAKAQETEPLPALPQNLADRPMPKPPGKKDAAQDSEPLLLQGEPIPKAPEIPRSPEAQKAARFQRLPGRGILSRLIQKVRDYKAGRQAPKAEIIATQAPEMLSAKELEAISLLEKQAKEAIQDFKDIQN
ncbi:MAG: hypothetical protein KDK62_04730 [Chlamydiia bacterium]|nr:hypothetical protein [Chlamydiia bacterium]